MMVNKHFSLMIQLLLHHHSNKDFFLYFYKKVEMMLIMISFSIITMLDKIYLYLLTTIRPDVFETIRCSFRLFDNNRNYKSQI